jgi:hypothetical protein
MEEKRSAHVSQDAGTSAEKFGESLSANSFGLASRQQNTFNALTGSLVYRPAPTVADCQ